MPNVHPLNTILALDIDAFVLSSAAMARSVKDVQNMSGRLAKELFALKVKEKKQAFELASSLLALKNLETKKDTMVLQIKRLETTDQLLKKVNKKMEQELNAGQVIATEYASLKTMHANLEQEMVVLQAKCQRLVNTNASQKAELSAQGIDGDSDSDDVTAEHEL